MRYIALEYAIAHSCDGGAYLVRCRSIAEIADAIVQCAGLDFECPPGISEEDWDKYCKDFCDTADSLAPYLWHNPNEDLSIPLPWREGFVVRAWRVNAREAKEWKE